MRHSSVVARSLAAAALQLATLASPFAARDAAATSTTRVSGEIVRGR